MQGERTAVRILLVEDDPGDARLLTRSLPSGEVVGHVDTLRAAIAWLAEHRADLVLLDLGLPDSIGLATLEGLLEAHSDVPVVVLSGTDDDDHAAAAIEAGAEEYLVKGSVDATVVGRTLRHAVERHRLQHDLHERAKEMAALNAITRELQSEHDLPQTVQAVADRLRAGMQWPEVCHTAITVDGETATSGPAGASADSGLAADIVREGVGRGRLEVRYVEERPCMLPQEQALLDATADAIAMWLGRRDAAETLRRSEERLRVLVSQMPGLLWTADTELRTTAYDGALLAELGIDPEALIGVPILDMLESDPSVTLDLLHDVLAGTPTTFERTWRGRSWRNYLEPKRDADGRIVGVVGLSLDVSEEKEQARQLVDTRARLEGLFRNASEAMLLADDTGRIVDANPAVCELTGYPHDELLELHIWDVSADDDGPDVNLVKWQELIAAGAMAGDHELARRDGSTVAAEFRAVANIVPGVHLSVMRDVTSRKQAEAALAASEERFRTMAEAAQDAIYRVRTRPTYAVEYFNPAVESVSGFSSADFEARPSLYFDRAHPDDVHLLDPARLRPGTTETVTVRFRHGDGHWVWLEDSRSPIVEHGATVGVQGVIRDVTLRRRTQQALQEALEAERRATEQLRSADQIKSHFLQAVSHELRTPLTAVLGMSATLVDRGPQLSAEETAYFQQRVLANARKLDGLLSDLLDLERLEHGVARIDRRDTELSGLIARVAQEVEFGGRQVTIEHRPVVAPVDPDRVERIVHNLLTNAVKHTPPGTEITVRCEAGPDAATIEVADDGPGIPDELALAVFEPFRQGPRSYESASPGTGIGLSIVRQFAALHGGTAWVRETAGGGATFTVRLPFSHDHEQADHAHGSGGTPGSRGAPATPTTPTTPTSPASQPGAQSESVVAIRTTTAAVPDRSTRSMPDGAAVAAWATRELLTATSKQEIVGVLLRVVHQLGGWTVPARVADELQALPLDISLGTSDPLLPAAEPTSVERMLLERHLPQLMADARHAADTIVNTQRLVEAATTDGLTRLPDRSRFERLQARLRDDDVVVTFRLDELREVNEAHGPAAGDDVLREFAACLKASLRAEDEAARLGGDEFAALLRNTDTMGVTALLERLEARWARQRPHPVDFHAEVTTA